jgi:urease accessory protein
MLAHLGHGLGGFWPGLLHPLTGPDHLLAMVSVGILAAVVADRRVAWATPAAFVGGMVAGGALGLAGARVGLLETALAASVVVLGALIAASTRPSFRVGGWFPVVALGFGMLHGIAHGGEVPGSASPFAYVAGFVSATAALHLSGVLVGTTAGRNATVRTALAGLVAVGGVALLAMPA